MTTKLDLFQKRALSNFTQKISENELRKEVIGELNEICIKDISYFYGNSEVTACNGQFSTTWALESMNSVNYFYSILEESIDK